MSPMDHAELDRLLEELHAAGAAEIMEAITRLQSRLRSLDLSQLPRAVEAICDLFYIDLFDRPDLQPALDRAEEALAEAAGAGPSVIPLLIRQMEGSDIKSHMHLARVLGRIGTPALSHLRRVVATSEDPYGRSFALFAIGKIKSPAVHEALPEVVGALMHPDKEVRDSAARTVGKIVEVVAPLDLSERRRTEMYEALCRVISDPLPALRAKATRSLGKMAQRGYLDSTQRRDLRARLESLVTRGETTDWDRAFIVRRQAQEALDALDRARDDG